MDMDNSVVNVGGGGVEVEEDIVGINDDRKSEKEIKKKNK